MDFIFYYPKIPNFGLCGGGRYVDTLTGSEAAALAGIPCVIPGLYDICAVVYPIDVEGTICGELSYDGIALNDVTLTPDELNGLTTGDPTVFDSILERAVVKQSDHFDGRGFIVDAFGTGTREPTSVPSPPPTDEPTTLVPTNAPSTLEPTLAPTTPQPTDSPILPTANPTSAPTLSSPPSGLSQEALIGIGVGAAASLALGALALQIRSRRGASSTEAVPKKIEL